MNVTVSPSVPCGTVRAVSSKSAAHRLLICAAFAETETVIRCNTTNMDIDATVSCLCALGAKISYIPPCFYVTPIRECVSSACLNCGESGSTLRFLLPVAAALGVNTTFNLAGRLAHRPLSPLYEELVRQGVRLSPQGSNPLTCQGKLEGNDFRISGNVSSQFISGLLFALTFSGRGGSITVEGKTESQSYIDMTADALARFGVYIKKTSDGYTVPKDARLIPPSKEITVEGDWSNAAFPLCIGAIGDGEVTVEGVHLHSRQGDMAIVEILRRFGAEVVTENGSVTVKGGNTLHGTHIDASQIPDLVPVLATVASVAEGKTVIYGASRLRIKESDRLLTTKTMLTDLGADVSETEDGLIINGKDRLTGGITQGFNDHRIAMSAAVASVVCSLPVTVTGAECVAKSYPDFWSDIIKDLKIQTIAEGI